MADSYKLVIGYNSKQFEQGNYTPDTWRVFDVVRNRSVSMSSNLATQPMQSGDSVTDHMYRNPINYHVTGIFSTHGSRSAKLSYNFEETNRLQDIQDFFENINRNGYLCTLRLEENSEEGNAGLNFKIREHMALKSISWTEYATHMEFSMEFAEIIVVDKQVYNNAEDLLMELYPDVVGTKTISLHDYYMAEDSDLIFNQVVQVLADNGYIDQEYIKAASDNPNSPLYEAYQNKTAAMGAVGLGLTSIGIGVGYAVATLAGPVGWVIALGVTAAVGIGVGIAAGARSSKTKKEEERLKEKDQYIIKLINGSTDAGNKKLQEIKDAVKVAVSKLNLDCKIYNIEGESGKNAQIMIMIGGKFYIMEFKFNKGSNQPSLTVTDFATGSQPAEISNTNAPLVVHMENMSAEDGGDRWFSYNGYDVYVVNTAVGFAEKTGDQSKITAAYKDVKNYSIWVSNGPIKNKLQSVANVLIDTLKAKGYEV